MRHYHGTPLGGSRSSVARFVVGKNRHFMVPFPRQEDLPIIADSATGMAFDNGAFTAWRQGKPIEDWEPYAKWVAQWCRHPRFDFAMIPDVIDGEETDNDKLINWWERRFAKVNHLAGVPVWHLHESLSRLERLVSSYWPMVALGSSGEFATPGTESWWARMHEVMEVATDEQGVPRKRLHGLRMLNREIVERLPLYSADSTNVAQNKGLLPRFGMYVPPHADQRAEIIAVRIESANSPPQWIPRNHDQSMFDWYCPTLTAGYEPADQGGGE